MRQCGLRYRRRRTQRSEHEESGDRGGNGRHGQQRESMGVSRLSRRSARAYPWDDDATHHCSPDRSADGAYVRVHSTGDARLLGWNAHHKEGRHRGEGSDIAIAVEVANDRSDPHIVT